MITIEQIPDSINADLGLLNVDDTRNSQLLKMALFDATYKALSECEVTSKLTRNSDDFFNANVLYISTLSMYLEILNAGILEFPLPNDDEKYYVAEQSAIFIALIAKLFRTARNITSIDVLATTLPGKMWSENIKSLYNK